MRSGHMVYLCMTIADWQYSMPARSMPLNEFRDYLRFSLAAEGFNLNRHISHSRGPAFIVFSQDTREPVEA